MDFRSAQPQASHSATSVAPAGVPVKNSKKDRDDSRSTWFRTAVVALLFCITVLVIAVIGVISVGGHDQSKFVDAKKYQAVFLTNGQVYFGNLKEVNQDFFRLQNIYYLTQNTTTNASGQTTTDGNYTLVKLGCQQIHDPYDQMVISHDQVSFWENLQDSGKVVTSIKQFQKQNPNGPDCSKVSNQTQASTDTSTQQSSTTTSTSTPAKKP